MNGNADTLPVGVLHRVQMYEISPLTWVKVAPVPPKKSEKPAPTVSGMARLFAK